MLFIDQLVISLHKLDNIPIIKDEKELWESLFKALRKQAEDKDILVVAHTPFSRVLGPIFDLNAIEPSDEAIKIASQIDKTPEKIEAVLQSSKKVLKVGRNVIITENLAGIVCANAGIDQSNAGIGKVVAVPQDPDALAREIRQKIKDECNLDLAVIVSDTVGRALRRAAVNIAIGVAGITAIKSEIGKEDLFGYTMRVSQIAIADEIASAAELLQGQTREASPFILVRGYEFEFEENVSAREVNRPEEERLFS